MKQLFIRMREGDPFLRAITLTILMLFYVVGNELYAQQQPTFTFSLKNVTLAEAIKTIESRSDYTFFLNDSKINKNTRVSVNEKNAPMTKVLDAIFAGTSYEYSLSGKQIVITLKKTVTKSEKKRLVKGSVKDESGEAVIGASVKIKDESIGTATDLDGRFTIELPDDKSELQISFIGYLAQSVRVKNDVVNVVLKEDTKLLDEVVVVGYGTQTKKTLTGAVSMVNMDNLETSTVTTVSHALAGKAAGLKVNMQSAQPGGGSKFRIRGEASTGAGNDPLFVIDGFPVGSGNSLGSGNIYEAGSTDNILESLNPDDIESISVLKDAASTAIYGARAGHGVILITTKRGKTKKATVTYSASGAIQNMRSNYEMLDVKQYMDMRNKQLHEMYLSKYALGIYSDYVTPSDDEIPAFTPMYTNDQIRRAKGTDWLKEVTRTGYMQQHNLSLNGGSESTRYMISVNYMNQEGVVKNNGTQRMSARFNFDQEINKYVSVGLTATYSQNQYKNVPLGDGANENSGVLTAAILANPAIPVYDEKGNYYIDPMRSTAPNPVSLLEIIDKTVKDRLLGSAFAIVKPVAGLELKAQLGADRRFQKRSNYLPKTTLEGLRNNGSAAISQDDGCDYLMDLTATYAKEIMGHNFKILCGYSFQKFTGGGLTAGNKDFLMDGFLYNNLGAGGYAKPTAESWAWKNSLGSYFARINYMFQNRYLFEATVRADGASNFAPENRWGFFPSLSAGWVMSEEAFMKNTSSWLSNLKWRFSYGQTGNSNVGNNINSYYSVGHNFVIGGEEQKGVYASQLGNPALTWETTSEFNAGVDLGLFNNRIRLTVEYFNRRITDLLVSNKPLLSYHEVNQIASNSGSTQSQGVELTLNTVNISNPNVDWNSTLTLSHYADRWLKRDADWKPESYQKENDPIRAWWSYKSLGLLQPGEKAPVAQADLLPGMMKLEDKNGDNVINKEDMYYIDNGDPKIIFGFNNAFRYKRFDFNIYFYGDAGRKRGSSYMEDWTRMDNGTNASVFAYKSFSSTNLNSIHPTNLVSNYGVGDYYVKSIYYIRCGSMTLGYNFPVSKKWMQNLKVYVDVNNPFVITNWTGLDPETDTGTFSYPNITSYSLGLNITF